MLGKERERGGGIIDEVLRGGGFIATPISVTVQEPYNRNGKAVKWAVKLEGITYSNEY